VGIAQRLRLRGVDSFLVSDSLIEVPRPSAIVKEPPRWRGIPLTSFPLASCTVTATPRARAILSALSTPAAKLRSTCRAAWLALDGCDRTAPVSLLDLPLADSDFRDDFRRWATGYLLGSRRFEAGVATLTGGAPTASRRARRSSSSNRLRSSAEMTAATSLP
jgi:hypothetical protein